MDTKEVKDYITKREIPLLFESMLTGMMYYQPSDPIAFLESCLDRVKELGGLENVQWDSFVDFKKKSQPGPPPPSQVADSSRVPKRQSAMPSTQPIMESDTERTAPKSKEIIEKSSVFDVSRPRPRIILVIGGPASGKSAQCVKIAAQYRYSHISVGKLLREKAAQNANSNKKWALVSKLITAGELIPLETTMAEIKTQMLQNQDAKGFIIDGYPRDVSQAICFDHQICEPDLVVYLTCCSTRLWERLQVRAKLGRPDDNPKAIQRRLATFRQNTTPLVNYYLEKGILVMVDALRGEEVFGEICATINSRFFSTGETATGGKEFDLSPVMEFDQEEEKMEDDQAFFDEAQKPDKAIIDGQKELLQTILVSQMVQQDDNVENSALYQLYKVYPETTAAQKGQLSSDRMASYMPRKSKEEMARSRREEERLEKLKKCKLIFLVGGPGSGACSQSDRLMAKYGFIHVSMGNLLRAEAVSNNPRSRQIKEIMQKGDLVPTDIVMTLLRDSVVSRLDSCKGFLITGFPREIKQGEEFEKMMAPPTIVIVIDCSMDTMTKRLLIRGQTSRRYDEDEATIKKRLDAYYRNCDSVITYYERKRLVRKINGEGAADEVFQKCCSIIDSLM